MQDYIMRIIEQFVQAIVSIMRRRKAGESQEARKEAHSALRYFLKINVDLLFVYSEEQVLELLKDLNGNLEVEKCVLTADLLYELALVEEAEKKQEVALHLKKISLYLYAVGIPKELRFQIVEYLSKVEVLIGDLKDLRFSEKVSFALREYQRRFAKL